MQKNLKIGLIILLILIPIIIITFFYGAFSSSSDLFGEVISEIDTNEKIVFLTFDDGPSYQTFKILDILKEKNVTATFFVVGNNIDNRTIPIMKRTVEEGHNIGTHSMSHKYLNTNIYEEVFKSKELIEKYIGQEVIYFRPPFGFRTPETMKQAKDYELKTIMWSSFPRDYMNNANKTVEIVLDDLKPGLIIDLHDTGKENLTTIEALPIIIDEIREENYTFGNLNDWIK